MKPLTEAEVVDLRVRALKRLIELHEENEYLKKELRARRRQADVWRKKYQAQQRTHESRT